MSRSNFPLYFLSSLVCLASAEQDSVNATTASPLFGAYFANWAQYHKAPYTHTPASLAPIIGRTDRLNYGFVYFCPPAGTSPMPYWSVAPFGSCTDATEFQLMSVEPKDPQFIQQIVAYKKQNPNLKVIASIGGWNFPSAYFSKMVASSASRAKFITSAKSFMASHSIDGIDLDWEFPCSAPRNDPVKISCTQFRQSQDAGGSCPADTNNLLTFVQELRQGLGSGAIISIASQAGEKNWEAMNIKAVSQYIDYYNVMTYDYTVPDVADGSLMSPNAPLYTPDPPASQMSIDYSIQGYLNAGVPASKILVGIPFYGHTWYQTGMANWQKFGQKGSIQGECCGPFKQTFGGKPGQACSQCGVMMYNEILAALGGDESQVYYDNKTQSAIAYFSHEGADSYTEAGTWVSYANPASIQAIVAYALKNNLAGVFIFDTSQDTLDGQGGFSFKLMNEIADAMNKPGPSPPSPSPPSPGPPSGSCANLPAGDYCFADDAKDYLVCPNGIKMPCAPGTCCKPGASAGTINCVAC
mmetsp:Transcript_37102/g.72879  ORF Transcript_37102/g.72879 Transcript_37102/m.72879 type:complete len:526 (+) Transcript_37102:42-1619(+)|eukprot:CAMPEP_0175155092 /NCGR_PEP_ID=MMETSP0087-20121206/20761_1 /TAXON_ID=136419 /ORGANISM="Unknown Unknown, Strain D1" /LENGTH=525 /DNA_ID=CAMNT_0016442165 /DNA_START=42 /DNA_END=1619 /DNA_ORIENTATION=+